jgi:PIN domain nuclease of toxin-antitoxin system
MHQILSLTVEEASVAYLTQLPSIHRDPFDRMIICQANVHALILMTDDEIIRQYPVQIFK